MASTSAVEDAAAALASSSASPVAPRQRSTSPRSASSSTCMPDPPPSSAKEKRQHKRRRTERRTASCGGGGASASGLLEQRFCEVELQFQLEQDRAQRTTLTPRDVANLVLWSVPSPIPIIESPRIFFIKNKSRLRNVVVLYVNGWSYDEMLCTGAGLPRTREDGGADGSTAAVADATDGAAAGWDEVLCKQMLSAVREGRCWARPSRGTGCAGGVQYCPLFIPSTRNELEKDLWWRNDAPRRPGPSSSSSSAPAAAPPRPGRGHAAAGDGDTVNVHRTNLTAEEARGVGSMFQKAMRVHTSGSGSGADASAASVDAAPSSASDAFRQHQHLWQDRQLLRQYALHLPESVAVLQELGFTLTPPPPPPPSATTATATSRAASEEQRHGPAVATAAEAAEEEAWVSFPAAVASSAVRVVALDCEMVQVESGESALARATLVDVVTGEVVLDMLVKPRERVTDYLTRYSGIDAAILEPVSATLADCQRSLQRHVDAETFVVGHSLENDFKACKCIPNCYVLDTTWLYPHPAGLPYKNALRFLAQRYLQRRIQQGAHDSAVDALVSAELAQLKLIHGPGFGLRPRVSVLGLVADAAGAAPCASESATAAAPALEVAVQLFDDAATLGSLLPSPPRAAPAEGGEASAPTPAPASASSGRIDAVPVRHDEDAMRKAVRALQRRATQRAGERDGADTPSYVLFWVQLTQARVDVRLAPTHAPSADDNGVVDSSDSSAVDASRGAHAAAQLRTVHDTNRRVLRIVEACPDDSLVVVLAGRCDGEASGNHFSRAQGTCFAFVKDSSAAGPREDELTKQVDTTTATGGPHEPTPTPLVAAAEATAAEATAAEATAAARRDTRSAVVSNTPPACQQQ
ncbi:Exonuclease [Novymonas esmeraldas]|uniref:Exonuclease n=1 Tax=Novymonas esmeraldas TaxID=1808958 RepID=A0AAW0ETG1_9TRYP